MKTAHKPADVDDAAPMNSKVVHHEPPPRHHHVSEPAASKGHRSEPDGDESAARKPRRHARGNKSRTHHARALKRRVHDSFFRKRRVRHHKRHAHHSRLAGSGYVNLLAHARVTPERIDMGVDYAGRGTLTSIGRARITYVGISGTGWPGAFIEYQLIDGRDAGRFVYYAEGVRPAGGVSAGSVVRAGQAVAYLIPGWSTGVEIGWGAGSGTGTLAAKLGQNRFPTAAGESFSRLIASLGGPPGIG